MHSLALFLQQNSLDPKMIAGIIAAYVAIFAVFYVITVTIVMIPVWFILKKTGYTPWLSLLCLLPSLGVLVLLYVLAFADWPSQRPAMRAGYLPPLPPTA